MEIYKRKNRDGKPGKYWWYRFRFNGKEIDRSSKSVRRTIAEKAGIEHREELARVYRGGKERPRFSNTMLAYLKHCELNLKPSTHTRYVVSCKALIPYFTDPQDKFLDEIKRGDIVEFRDYRLSKGVTKSTVNRDVSCLSGMFEFAIERELSDMNPCHTVRKMREPAGKRRYLSELEYARVLEEAKVHFLREMIIVAVETGMRQQEQFTLTWPQVDMERRDIHLKETKSGQPRTIPMSDTAYAVFKSLPKHFSSRYVFYKPDGSAYGDRKKPLSTVIATINKKLACEELDPMPEFTWHDLRRTCGCWWLQAGKSMEVLRVMLGHSSIATTERCYAFLRHEDVRREMERGQKDQRERGHKND